MDLSPDGWGLTALKCWNYFGKTLTLNAPNRNKVGSRPTEKIRRRMVEAISARMPWGWGKTMTMARETSIAIHRRADKWGSRVPEGGDRREKLPHFLQKCNYPSPFVWISLILSCENPGEDITRHIFTAPPKTNTPFWSHLLLPLHVQDHMTGTCYITLGCGLKIHLALAKFTRSSPR